MKASQARVRELTVALEGLAPWFFGIADADAGADARDAVARARRAMHPGDTCTWRKDARFNANARLTTCGALAWLPYLPAHATRCPYCHRPIQHETANRTSAELDGAHVTRENAP